MLWLNSPLIFLHVVIMHYIQSLMSFIEGNRVLSISFSLLLLIMAGMVTHLICKFFIVKVIRKVFFSSHKRACRWIKMSASLRSCQILCR